MQCLGTASHHVVNALSRMLDLQICLLHLAHAFCSLSEPSYQPFTNLCAFQAVVCSDVTTQQSCLQNCSSQMQYRFVCKTSISMNQHYSVISKTVLFSNIPTDVLTQVIFAELYFIPLRYSNSSTEL